jgi:hypothetical protein
MCARGCKQYSLYKAHKSFGFEVINICPMFEVNLNNVVSGLFVWPGPLTGIVE